MCRIRPPVYRRFRANRRTEISFDSTDGSCKTTILLNSPNSQHTTNYRISYPSITQQWTSALCLLDLRDVSPRLLQISGRHSEECIAHSVQHDSPLGELAGTNRLDEASAKILDRVDAQSHDKVIADANREGKRLCDLGSSPAKESGWCGECVDAEVGEA